MDAHHRCAQYYESNQCTYRKGPQLFNHLPIFSNLMVVQGQVIVIVNVHSFRYTVVKMCWCDGSKGHGRDNNREGKFVWVSSAADSRDQKINRFQMCLLNKILFRILGGVCPPSTKCFFHSLRRNASRIPTEELVAGRRSIHSGLSSCGGSFHALSEDRMSREETTREFAVWSWRRRQPRNNDQETSCPPREEQKRQQVSNLTMVFWRAERSM